MAAGDGWMVPLASTREGYSSVDEVVGVVATSNGEAHASVGLLIGYGEIFHERTGYASVTEAVSVAASSTREGYASVGILLDYSSIYDERTGYASVETAVSFRLPEFDEVGLTIMGWGIPLQPSQTLVIFRGSSEGVTSVAEYVTFDEHPENRTASASVDTYVVSSL